MVSFLAATVYECPFAKNPKVRSLAQPCGYDLCDEEVVIGNLHVAQSCVLGRVQASRGNEHVGETPHNNLLRHTFFLENWTFGGLQHDPI